MENLRIINALPEHEALVRALSDQTHRVHRERLPHKFGPDNGYQHFLLDAAVGHTAITKFRCLLRVACREDAFLGYALVVWDEAAGHDVPAVIADIAVTPAFQRQGIGRALLADLEGLRATKSWHSLTADVWHGNAASHAMFLQAGFNPDRTEFCKGSPPALDVTLSPAPENGNSKTLLWIAAWSVLIVVITVLIA